jgi:glycosyltransferase involved in cell wall biosynthesis
MARSEWFARVVRPPCAAQFAEVLEAVGTQLIDRGFVPLLCGAAAEKTYAAEVIERVRSATAGRAVLLEHLGAEELAAVFARTALNFHPCVYDAYGMSIVEAAAFGAPSMINGGGTIGAAALLDAGVGVLAADLTAPAAEVGVAVLEALDEHERLDEVAQAGKSRALDWGEEAAGCALHEAVKEMLRASA